MLHFFLLAILPFHFAANDLSNVLIYTDPVQVSASINAYENIVPGVPIQGSIMITHNRGAKVEADSFRIGDKPLAVTFVESMPMSEFSPLVVTIYHFRLDGMQKGSYTLPVFTVKVGDKEYQAPPVTVQVGGDSPNS